jgi:hypothetical protein
MEEGKHGGSVLCKLLQGRESFGFSARDEMEMGEKRHIMHFHRKKRGCFVGSALGGSNIVISLASEWLAIYLVLLMDSSRHCQNLIVYGGDRDFLYCF